MTATSFSRPSTRLCVMALLVLCLAVPCGRPDEPVAEVERDVPVLADFQRADQRLLSLDCQYSYGPTYEGSRPFSWRLRVSQDGAAELSTFDECGDLVSEAAVLTPEEFQPLAAAYDSVQASGCANRYLTHGMDVAHFRITATCDGSEKVLETVGAAIPPELAALQEALITVKRSLE